MLLIMCDSTKNENHHSHLVQIHQHFDPKPSRQCDPSLRSFGWRLCVCVCVCVVLCCVFVCVRERERERVRECEKGRACDVKMRAHTVFFFSAVFIH